MFFSTFLLVPALFLQAPEAAPIVDLGHGIHVLKGAPSTAMVAELKRLRITQVIDFRDDSELGGMDEGPALSAVGANYMRYAITRTPPDGDFKFIREILNGYHGVRILLHCRNGNRAAAAVCPWLVLDQGMKLEDAIQLCRQAGMQAPETEAAVRRYLASQMKA